MPLTQPDDPGEPDARNAAPVPGGRLIDEIAYNFIYEYIIKNCHIEHMFNIELLCSP